MIDRNWLPDHKADRRDAIRRRSRRKALVVVNEQGSTMDAQILSLSRDGAMIELDGIFVFPEEFQVRFDGLVKKATVVWRRGLKAGVSFALTDGEIP